MRPLSIELRKPRAGVGYRSTSVSRTPSPVPRPRKAPVKIIRPPRESVASTSKIERPAVKIASQTASLRKAKTQESTPNLPPSPSKKSVPAHPPLHSPTAISSPSLPPMPFVPSDLYISIMSGLAMANMPQTMQVAAAADPMGAFQLAQMYFTPTSSFPLPPFPLIPPQPDRKVVQPQLHTPNLPPKPVTGSITKSNTKLAPSPSTPQEDNPKLTPTPPTAPLDPSSMTLDMDPLLLKQKRQARKHKIGWIPEPVLPDRGTFNLVPTHNYVHWFSSDEATPPDPQRSLVMEDLPVNCRTIEFVRSWSDRFSATAIYLNGDGKALIEFPLREIAEEAYDSPRLRDGPYKRAMHVRVFWYRAKVDDTTSSAPTTSGNADITEEMEDVPADVTPANIDSGLGEPPSLDIDGPGSLAETTETQRTAQSKGMGKGFSLPPPERDPVDVDLPVRSYTVPTSISRQGSPLMANPFTKVDREEQRQRSNRVEQITEGSLGGFKYTHPRPPVSPSPSASIISCIKISSPHFRSPSPGGTERKRTPTESPPSLRYPSSTPEMTNHPGRVSSPSEGTSAHGTLSPTTTSEPSVAGDFSLEQQLRMRLLAMKQTRIMNRSSEQPSSVSTPSADVDVEPDTIFQVTSPPPISQAPGIVTSESLELLATSFIADVLQAAQGLPSEPERFDTAVKARLDKKRGSQDAFGTSADIAFKRQRLAQHIEESKRIMERLQAAKSKEERNRIYALWEESNRFVSLNCVDCVLMLLCDPFCRYF